MVHCHFMQEGEIQAIVGDGRRDGDGGMQYAGLWSLTSRHRAFNAFGNSYAGLLPGPIRGMHSVLHVVDESTCALTRQATQRRPFQVRAVYQVKAPYYVDHTLTLCDKQDQSDAQGFREVSSCSYMNCPEDPRLHFASEGCWARYMSPEHGVASSIAPSYIDERNLERRPPGGKDRPFHWDRASVRFDKPFYYGRLGPMVILFIFDKPEWLRFFCSPTGGGASLLPGQNCPAWDFEWIIPKSAYAPGREYEFRVRLAYKQFVSDQDILEEYAKAVSELGYEEAPSPR